MTLVRRRNTINPITRIPADFHVHLTVEKKKIRCHANELSECGILLNSSHKELVGKNASILLMLDNPTPPLSLSGVVISATKDTMEIRFQHMSLEQQAQIASYVRARGIGIERLKAAGE